MVIVYEDQSDGRRAGTALELPAETHHPNTGGGKKRQQHNRGCAVPSGGHRGPWALAGSLYPTAGFVERTFVASIDRAIVYSQKTRDRTQNFSPRFSN